LRRFVAGQAVAGAPVAAGRPPEPARRAAQDRAATRRAAPAPPVEEALVEDELDIEDGRRSWPSWRVLASSVLCLVGLGIAIYETIGHYANFALLCAANSTFNCEAVTHSPESVVFGIPVAVLGLVFFVPMLGLCSPWAWRSANRFVAPARLASMVVGVGFVFYLIYTELFTIGKICLWCSGVHLVTLILFVVVATGWEEATRPARLAAEEGASFTWWGSPAR
jgi:uncharacterized membrane protein